MSGAEGWRRQLEGERDRFRTENRELRVKVALHESGLVGLNDRQLRALFAAHEGDMTAAALQATADELFPARSKET